MPWQARELSESGYYHLIVRGIGWQAIFEDGEDHTFYLSRLSRYSREAAVPVCAYCLKGISRNIVQRA